MASAPITVSRRVFCTSTTGDAPVTAERTLSMSTGLEASTVTPGRTAPDVSLTVPVIVAWAHAAVGTRTVHMSTTAIFAKPRMVTFLRPLGGQSDIPHPGDTVTA